MQITADQCPRISAAHLAAERIRLGDALYRQEYFGAFVSAPGSVFDAEVLAHMFGDDAEEEPEGPLSVMEGRIVDRFFNNIRGKGGRCARRLFYAAGHARVAETRRVALGSRAPLGYRTSTQALSPPVVLSGVQPVYERILPTRGDHRVVADRCPRVGPRGDRGVDGRRS